MSTSQGLFGSYTSITMLPDQRKFSITLVALILALFAVLIYGRYQAGVLEATKKQAAAAAIAPLVHAQQEQAQEVVKQVEITQVKDDIVVEFQAEKQKVETLAKVITRKPPPVKTPRVIQKKDPVLTVVEQKAFVDDSLAVHQELMQVFYTTQNLSMTGELQ